MYGSADSSVEITYNSTGEIGGFQFTMSNLYLLGASGGAAEDAGFTVSVGSAFILGFSFDGSSIPAGEGLLTNLSIEVDGFTTEACLSDIVLSDMAANTTGHRQTDHIRTTHLLEIALDFSIENLNSNGVFLAKCFKGGTEKEALDLMQKNFSKVHHVKPDASRKESVEGYVIALGFEGK